MKLERKENVTYNFIAGSQFTRNAIATIVLPLLVLLCVQVINAQVPSNYELCAKEGEQCQFAGWRTVRYGANGIWAEKTAYNQVLCGVVAFGKDPVPNVLKSCYLVSPPAKNIPTFQMIFASDPQYAFCVSDACKNGPKDSKTANQWHSMAIGKLAGTFADYQGVVINGDLTNTMDQYQIDVFESLYASKYLIYPGLGNHDYQNYTAYNLGKKDSESWGAYDGNAVSRYGGQLNLMMYFAKTVRANNNIQGFDWDDSDHWNRSGSLAYYFDIGDYRFIQLNNFPPFAYKFSNFAARKAGNENYDIQSSLPWLRTVLSKSKNKKVILNMHSINSSDGFGSFDYDGDGNYQRGGYSQPQWKTGALEFGRILGENPNVVAIFAGHLHSYVGDQYFDNGTLKSIEGSAQYDRRNARNEVMTGQAVPVLFSGSAEYNILLSVKFEPTKITAQPYRTLNGNPTSIGTAKVISGLDPAIASKGKDLQTPPPTSAVRTITFKNEAGYVAKLSVVYFVNQNINGTQVPIAKALETPAIPVGQSKTLEIPRDNAKGMPIRVGIDGIGTTKGKVLDIAVPEGFNGNLCFKSWGTIFDAKGGACQ
ncbi:MAG TPA: metallophosphoesterase [Blastocatellia bacterium]|nr:metallophosphoesterase [Blastocatellia bacterium]